MAPRPFPWRRWPLPIASHTHPLRSSASRTHPPRQFRFCTPIPLGSSALEAPSGAKRISRPSCLVKADLSTLLLRQSGSLDPLASPIPVGSSQADPSTRVFRRKRAVRAGLGAQAELDNSCKLGSADTSATRASSEARGNRDEGGRGPPPGLTGSRGFPRRGSRRAARRARCRRPRPRCTCPRRGRRCRRRRTASPRCSRPGCRVGRAWRRPRCGR